MVVRANKVEHNIAGTFRRTLRRRRCMRWGSTTFSAARSENFEGRHDLFQGHAAPGILARAYLEGRLSTEKLENFRRS